MFTGIIEEIGVIKQIRKLEQAIEMTIIAEYILKDVQLGDSISVNGVCLTVTDFDSSMFTVDIMPETVKSSSLKELSIGSRVNLERAMSANGRFGGHFVSGHVDSIGKIVKKRALANAIYYTIETPKELSHLFMLKGSVAIDGTSLTIFEIEDQTITVSLIPHTRGHTILGSKVDGDIVNIECDMLAKYVANMMMNKNAEDKHSSKIDQNFLQENGFI